MQEDSIGKTIGVAAGLCIVCSILVSSAAVGLKPLQDENKALDLKKNLLASAGLVDAKAGKTEIENAYKNVETKLVDLKTGEYVTNMDPEKFDQIAAAKDPKTSTVIDSKKDIAKIRTKENYSKVFLIKEGSKVSQIVLPIRGKGLWSTLWGFVSIKPDTKTVSGISFYKHGETPGLGGEVDNPRWKKSWVGKKLMDTSNNPKFSLVKVYNPQSPDAIHHVDALSGATITSVGVENLVRYWFGQEGFGPYLAKVRNGGI